MDLGTFLLARIAEDEQLARDAAGDFPDWIDSSKETRDGENVYFTVTATRGAGKRGAVWESDYFLSILEDGRDDARVGHIARHDPARVLAECEAKRRIVAWEMQIAGRAHLLSEQRVVLQVLALPYAEHPSYDEAWCP